MRRTKLILLQTVLGTRRLFVRITDEFDGFYAKLIKGIHCTLGSNNNIISTIIFNFI